MSRSSFAPLAILLAVLVWPGMVRAADVFTVGALTVADEKAVFATV
jgi:hypothetical protein